MAASYASSLTHATRIIASFLTRHIYVRLSCKQPQRLQYSPWQGNAQERQDSRWHSEEYLRRSVSSFRDRNEERGAISIPKRSGRVSACLNMRSSESRCPLR